MSDEPVEKIPLRNIPGLIRLGRPPGVKETKPRKRDYTKSKPRKSRGRMSLEERRARSDERKRLKGLETAPSVRQAVEVFDGRVESLPAPSTPSVPAVADDQRMRIVRALDERGVDERFLVRVCEEATGATVMQRAGGGEYVEKPDHSTRLKGAAELKGMMQLAGKMPVDVKEESATRTTIMIRIEADGSRTAIAHEVSG